jgi:hypothetical protein
MQLPLADDFEPTERPAPRRAPAPNERRIVPTDEQAKIIAHDPKNSLVVIAYAGTGKTSTLVEYAKAWTRPRGLYLAFNKAIADEANRRFRGTNVVAKTAHGYAYGMLGVSQYADRITNQIRWQHVRDAQIDLVNRYLAHDVMVDAVTRGIRTFALDSAPRPSSWHCGLNHLPPAIQHGVMPILSKAIRAFYMFEKSGLPFTHDIYLKRLELAGGISTEFDYLMVDEAQDLNPVLISLVEKSRLPAIIVGDPFQSIYAWRGAVSAMRSFKAPTLPLTQSWRFGESTALVANHILSKTTDGMGLPVRGRPEQETTIAAYNGLAPVGSFIIARTNGRLFEGLVKFQRPFHITGGFEEMTTQITSAYALSKGDMRNVKDSYVKLYPTWDLLVLDGDDRNDPDAKKLTKIIETYGDQIPAIIQRLRGLHKPSAKDADYILSTGHRSKGLEFDTVVVLDDFSTPEELLAKRLANDINPTAYDQELHLMYVALTRAKNNLIVSDPLYASLEDQGVVPRRPEHAPTANGHT